MQIFKMEVSNQIGDRPSYTHFESVPDRYPGSPMGFEGEDPVHRAKKTLVYWNNSRRADEPERHLKRVFEVIEKELWSWND